MPVSDHDGLLRSKAEVSAAPTALQECSTHADRRRCRWLLGFLLLLLILFAKPLVELARYAWASDFYSHILLIPFIMIYLVWSDRHELPLARGSSPGLAALSLGVGVLVMLAYWIRTKQGWLPNQNEYLAITILAFLAALIGGLFAFLGRETVRAMAFPLAMLIFLIPIPAFLTAMIETFFQHSSALASYVLFKASGTPVFRQGLLFYLPGVVIEVAAECSGIRSSLVLFIVSLLSGRLFLKTPWKRAVLALAVIPLGILRNGVRIFTICMLTIHVDPNTINGPLHHRGGPVFFVLSLVPFFGLLWWLRRSETPAKLRVES